MSTRFGVVGDHSGTCEGCGGLGVRVPATPSCVLPDNDGPGWLVAEKCDVCNRYPDDQAAATVLFETVKWVQCTAGGWHVLCRNRRRSHLDSA